MGSSIISLPVTLPAGEIVAIGVSFDDYMQHYAADFHEWVEGVVIKMSPVTAKHDDLSGHFYLLFRAYFAHNPIGIIRRDPFVMKLDPAKSGREPDSQVILKTNPGNLTDTMMIGAADICIEAVSDESIGRDYGDKFKEYEQGGVREYWIIDPLRKTPIFHRLNAEGQWGFRLRARLEEGMRDWWYSRRLVHDDKNVSSCTC